MNVRDSPSGEKLKKCSKVLEECAFAACSIMQSSSLTSYTVFDSVICKIFEWRSAWAPPVEKGEACRETAAFRI